MRPCGTLVAYLLAYVSFLVATVRAEGIMPGWKMTDRFSGFRYECILRSGASKEDFVMAVRDEADALSGFGWVQIARETSNVVGEFRGNRLTGGMMQRFLTTGGAERVADVVFEEDEVFGGGFVPNGDETDEEARAKAKEMEDRLIRQVEVAAKQGGLGSASDSTEGDPATGDDYVPTHPQSADCSIREYPDTKIRLHFSSFRILDSGRITCFHLPPHQCTADELNELDQML